MALRERGDGGRQVRERREPAFCVLKDGRKIWSRQISTRLADATIKSWDGKCENSAMGEYIGLLWSFSIGAVSPVSTNAVRNQDLTSRRSSSVFYNSKGTRGSNSGR